MENSAKDVGGGQAARACADGQGCEARRPRALEGQPRSPREARGGACPQSFVTRRGGAFAVNEPLLRLPLQGQNRSQVTRPCCVCVNTARQTPARRCSASSSLQESPAPRLAGGARTTAGSQTRNSGAGPSSRHSREFTQKGLKTETRHLKP